MCETSGSLRARQRRGHADVDDIQARELREVGGGAKVALFVDFGQRLLRNVLDVGDTLLQQTHLLCIDLEPCHVEARAGELDGQRQPHVAEPDHPDARLARVDAIAELLKSIHTVSSMSKIPRAGCFYRWRAM